MRIDIVTHSYIRENVWKKLHTISYVDLFVKVLRLAYGKITVQDAKQFLLDIISIIVEWNERVISDKAAMDKIARSLLNEKLYKIEPIYKQTTQKSAAIIAMASGLCIFLFVFVSFGDFTNVESNLQIENEKLIFEQLDESPPEANEKIQNNTTVEQFSNQMNLGLSPWEILCCNDWIFLSVSHGYDKRYDLKSSPTNHNLRYYLVITKSVNFSRLRGGDCIFTLCR